MKQAISLRPLSRLQLSPTFEDLLIMWLDANLFHLLHLEIVELGYEG